MNGEYYEDRPGLAVALTIFGGLLVLTWGAVLLSFANVPGYGFFPGLSAPLGGLGSLGLLFGVLLILLAALLYRNPSAHRGCGIAIVLFSLLSLFGGSGVVVGLVLGVIGGLAAIFFEPSGPIPVNPLEESPVEDACPWCDAPVPSDAPRCPSCGRSLESS